MARFPHLRGAAVVPPNGTAIMLDPSIQLQSAADWTHHRAVQKRALSDNAFMADITIAVVGDNASCFRRGSRLVSTVDAALGLLPFGRPSDAVINFLGKCFMVNALVPVADPLASTGTWPTIEIPLEEELDYFCDTQRESDDVLEVLREWRAHVDAYASTTVCSRLGWIGGIWVTHPRCAPDDESAPMSMRWPWLHRPYKIDQRPGDPKFFELYGVSVDRG